MSEYITSLPKTFNHLLGNDSILKNRKEKHYKHSLTLLAVNDQGEIKTVISSRFYHTPARSYCCVWSHLPDFTLKGGAYAGGYGYHQDSASLSYALHSAGIGVSGLEGHGDRAMKSALIELGQRMNKEYGLGLSGFTIITAHG